MIATLFKHEFKRTGRWLGLIALLMMLVVGVFLAGAFLLPSPLNSVVAFFGLIVALGAPMIVQLLLGLDFYRSTFSKTGYFTMTLPVKGATIFWVKFGYASLVAILFYLLGAGLAVVAGLGVAKAFVGSTRGYWETLREGVDALLDFAPAWLIALVILIVVLLPIAGLAHYFFAAAYGSESRFNRMGFGGVVLVWFIYYVVSQLVTLVGMLIPLNILIDGDGARWMPNSLDLFTTTSTDGVLPLGAFVAMYLLAAVAIWRTKVSLDKKVELR